MSSFREVGKCETSREDQVTLANDRLANCNARTWSRTGGIYILLPVALALYIGAVLSRAIANGNYLGVSSKRRLSSRLTYLHETLDFCSLRRAGDFLDLVGNVPDELTPLGD